MLGSIKAALASIATSIKSSIPTLVAATTATVITGGCIYYYTIKDGIYEKRDDNVRYALEQYISQVTIDSIVQKENGGYAYATDLDKVVKDIATKLKEAGSNIEEYTGKKKKEQILSKLIKAEIITQYPDLRTEDEIRKDEDVDKNELQGGIKIIRKNSSIDTSDTDEKDLTYKISEKDQVLTYIPYGEFSDKIAKKDTSVKKYFTLKSSGENSTSVDLVVAGWTKEQTTVKTVEYIPKDDESGDEEVVKEDIGKENYTFNEISINYQNMISKESMPAGFLWSLLVMGESTTFIEKLADLAINNTNIVIEAQDNTITNVNTTEQRYFCSKNITRTVEAEDGTTKTENVTITAKKESSKTTTITTTQSNTNLNLVYAETWVATYKKGYKNTIKKEELNTEKDWTKDAEWSQLEDETGEIATTESDNPDDDEEYEKLKNKIIDEITTEKCEQLLTKKIENLKNTDALYYVFNWDVNNENYIYNKSVDYMYNYIKGGFIEEFINNITIRLEMVEYITNFWNNKSKEVKDIYSENKIEKDDILDELYKILKEEANSMITLSSAQKTVQGYKTDNKTANNVQVTDTNVYTSAGTSVQERIDIDKDNNFVAYFKKSKKAKEYILQAPEWLYEMLASHEKTVNMIDLLKYLLYEATGDNYGVLEYNFEEYKNISFNSISGLYGSNFEEKIWFALIDAGYSKIATAGAMGNLYKESGIVANNLQNSYNKSLGLSDEEYTQKVNDGSYTREQFISDSAGYGLAQWTYSSRKAKLYDLAQEKGLGIDNESVQIEHLLKELQNWVSTSGGTKWKNATTIKEASEVYCDEFENPKVNNFDERTAKAEEYYNKYKDLEKPRGSNCPRYYQSDPRWGSNPYNYKSGGTISSGGCGACALAMAVSGLTNTEVTPDVIVNYLNSLNINTVYNGAKCAQEVAKKYGLTYEHINRTNKTAIDSALDNGKCLIFSIKANGIYTGDGHFIMCNARNGDSYYVLESGRYYETNRPYAFDQVFTEGVQGVFVLGR